MIIEPERKLINISILDRERNVREIIYHNSSFPLHFLEDLDYFFNIKVTIYEIIDNKEILLFKDISPNLPKNKLIGFKKLKLVFTYKNTSIVDLANFKFNSNINWDLIF